MILTVANRCRAQSIRKPTDTPLQPPTKPLDMTHHFAYVWFMRRAIAGSIFGLARLIHALLTVFGGVAVLAVIVILAANGTISVGLAIAIGVFGGPLIVWVLGLLHGVIGFVLYLVGRAISPERAREWEAEVAAQRGVTPDYL